MRPNFVGLALWFGRGMIPQVIQVG